MNRFYTLLKNHFPLVLVAGFSVFFFVMSLRVTMFRYSNFEYGKFDLGNMSQMVYNTLNGNFMEVTDYFGANMPRWGMSHVDPFLIIFVPFYAIFPDARVLIIGQLLFLISSAVILYFIGLNIIKSRLASAFIAIAFLFYPSVGYLLAWTGFHGVTAVVPVFLLAFLVFEEMYKRKSFTKKGLVLFFALVFITMMGKEEISLIIFMYGLFIFFFRGAKKVGITLSIFGILWFSYCFFVLIPGAAHYRIDGYQRFAQSLELDVDPTRDVLKPNYFLSRYDKFGSSYFEVAKNMVLHPTLVAEVFFAGDHKENFLMTFTPLLFLPLFCLPVLFIASPEFVINYLTTSGGIGTSEIYNHRISMIIPILFLAVLFSIKFFEDLIKTFIKKDPKYLSLFVSLIVLFANVYTSNVYQNPILLWFTQSLQKRISYLNDFAYAKEKVDKSEIMYITGQKVKVNRLETKDWKCFNGVVDLVPKDVSVTAPDYLGAHFSTRRINALFPANIDTSDYVVVDVNSKKVLSILGVNSDLINDAVGKVLKNPKYKLVYSCSNIFVFQKTEGVEKSTILPLQEDFAYKEKINFKIGQSLYLADYQVPASVERGTDFHIKYVYKREGSDSLNAYTIYTSFLNEKTESLHQIANLPSFGINPPVNWDEGTFYLEDNDFVLPSSLTPGIYKVFVGITNNVKTYNIYLTEIEVK